MKILKTKKTAFYKGNSLEYKLIFDEGSYDIQAKMYGESDEYVECVKDITTIKEYAISLFEEIVKNKVSPCHLCDIITDKICQ